MILARSSRPSTWSYDTPVAAASASRSTRCGVPKIRSKGAGVLRPALLQQPEDAAAAVVEHDDRQVRPRLVRADHQSGGVVQQREVAEQGVARGPRGRAPRRRPSRRCRRCPPHPGWPAPATSGRGFAASDTSRIAFDDPTTSSPSGGSASTSARARRRPVGAAGSSRAASRAVPAAASTSRHRSVQPRGRAPPGRRADRTDRSGDVGPRPAAGVREGEDGHPRVGEQSLDRPVQGRAPGDDHLRRREIVGQHSVDEGAEQPRSRTQPGVPDPRRGFGDHRQTPLAHLRRCAGAGDHERGRRGVQRQRGCLDPAARNRRPRRPVRASGRSRAGVRDQRLGEGQVDVHRPGRRPQRCGDGPAHGRAPRPVLALRVRRHGRRQGEPHRPAEDPRLHDRLVRAGPDQLRRPVRGEHQQRHPGVGGLQDGRVQVRDGGARGRRHRHRTPGPQREAQREEAGGPLVDPDVQPQATGGVGGVQREGQRGVARAGAEHGVGDPAAHQLVDDHLRVRGRGVHVRRG